MSLELRINDDIKTAMLGKEKERLNALRAIKSALLLLKTEKGAGEITEIWNENIAKTCQQRKESAELYKAQNRDDLYQEEICHLGFINQYLPSKCRKRK
jgi:uncharacterized protein YqeY